MSRFRLLWQSSVTATRRALAWNLDDLVPPSERYVFKFDSKEELKRWHLYSDSEYGGLSSASLEIKESANGSSGTGLFTITVHNIRSALLLSSGAYTFWIERCIG